jgi:hypothetical protein
MKKITIIVSVIIIIVTVYFFLHQKAQFHQPEHLSNIPAKAIWVGGSDGGSWFYINKVLSRNTFEISIYNDNNGELDKSAVFSIDSNCAVQKMDSLLLLETISAYDGNQIILKIRENGEKCALLPN